MNSKTEQRRAWLEASKRVKSMRDNLGKPVDASIVDTVIVLNLLGFHTSTSCGGHIRRATGGPYVVFESPDAQMYAKKIREYVDKAPQGENVYMHPSYKKTSLNATRLLS